MSQLRQRIRNNIRDIPQMLIAIAVLCYYCAWSLYLQMTGKTLETDDFTFEEQRLWFTLKHDQPELYKAAQRIAQSRGDYSERGILKALKEMH